MEADGVQRANAEQKRFAGPRVLVLCPLSNWMFQNFVPALRRQCGAVYALPVGDSMSNWEIPGWAKARQGVVDRMIGIANELARGPGLDLIFTMLYDDVVRADDARRLRALGVPIVHYHVDMNEQWYRVLQQAAYLDVLAAAHLQHLEPLMRRGVAVHAMPMAAALERYALAAVPEGTPECGVLFLGSPNSARVEVVGAACRAGVAVDVYGKGWESRLGGPAAPLATRAVLPEHRLTKRRLDLGYLVPRLMAEGTWALTRTSRAKYEPEAGLIRAAGAARLHGSARDEDVAPLMARARITLGVAQRAGRIGGRGSAADHRLRDFEAPMSGAFYLVQRFAELPLLYRVGTEVAAWSTLDELTEQIKWFWDHPAERAAIASAGAARARREHSWDARFAALFDRVGLRSRDGLRTEGQGGDGAGDLCPLIVPANLSRRPWNPAWPLCQPDSGSWEPALAHLK